VRLSAPFEVATAFPAWSWHGADVLPEDFAPGDDLRAFLTGVHASMAARDVDGMVRHLRVKASEMAAAFGIPIEERLRDQREFFAGLFAEPGFAMEPIDWEGLRPVRHAGGRLWECADRRGDPAVSSVPLPGGARFGLELFLCRRDGAWMICR
jgi:hypothetical protein